VPEQPEQGYGRGRRAYSDPRSGERGAVPSRQPRPSAAYGGPGDDAWSDHVQHDTRPGAGQAASRPVRPSTREPGLPAWAALGVLLVIAGIGGLIDQLGGTQIRGGFGWALVLASLVAILAVKRSHMFSIVIAPPLVYFAASTTMLYLRSGGLKDRKVLIDAATSWLVYGFPAIAGATAVVLLIAGIRLIARR
jgi:hypothetical protein